MTKNNGGPAFPTDSAAQVGPQTWHFEGMTLRDYFAAKAMAVAAEAEADRTIGDTEKQLGLKRGAYDYDTHWPVLVARAAYRFADAMLEARNA